MAWLWPWRGDPSSTASFEKTLSTLATKIASTQSDLDAVRSRSRRVKVLTTLYLSFAYVVYGIVVALVIGYRNMGPYEWTAISVGPVTIYAVRTTLAAFYSFRVDSLETRLKSFQTERATTIQKLKEATKYDSTLELIQKYGGTEAKPPKKKDGDGANAEPSRKGHPSIDGDGKEIQRTPGRTNMAPPPTANIPRREGPVSGPNTPQQHQPSPAQLHPYGHGHGLSPQTPSPRSEGPVPVSEEFAPNAFGSAPPAQQMAGRYDGTSASHWYDRVLDLLLGEDETAPKNRIVLICKQCRLVNGQAPPGTKSLAELGLWKCMACGASNGEMDEGARIVREVLEARQHETGVKRSPASVRSEAASLADSRDDDSSELVDVGKEEESEEEGKPKVRRRRGKGKK